MNLVDVEKALYLGDYVIEISFNDGFKQTINFKSFLFSSHHPDVVKYHNEDLFKQFSITDGDLEWNDYELCFPIADLYENTNIEINDPNAV